MDKKWVLSQHTTDEGEPIIKLPNGLWVATVGIDSDGSGERITASDARRNAELIVAMQNLCVALNPDNPLAAANAMEQAVAALQAWDAADAVHVNCRDCMDEHEPICDRCWNLLNEAAKKRLSALTALKGGEQ